MALGTFLTAAQAASRKYAPQYGLTPEQLYHALVMNADLEGGLGEEAGVGDNGASVGRFQFNTKGGHGETLMSQGMSRAQIADDAFQAEHWAPILAQALAGKLAQGYTGAEAVRHAAFEVERPAEIYPPSRVASANATASRMTGYNVETGTAGTGTGAGASSSTDPRLKALQDAANELLDDWVAGGSDPDDETYYAWQEANAALAAYMEVNGIDPRANGDDNAANDAISRWATIEGVNNDVASRAQNAWAEKNRNALTAADGEITSRVGRNKELAELQQARNQSSTPGLTPRGLEAGVAPGNWKETLQHYRDFYGATDAPEAGSPSTPPPDLSTPGGAQGVATGPAPIDSYHRSLTLDTWPDVQAESDTLPSIAERENRNFNLWGLAGPDAVDSSRTGGVQIGPGNDPRPEEPGIWDQLFGVGQTALGALTPMGRVNQARTATKKVKKWGSRFFADGGMNIPGGPGVVGEEEEEILFHPTFGARVVGKDGPEQIDIPEGSSILPMSQALKMQAMKKGMEPGAVPDNSAARANDPQAAQKAMESLRRAISAANAVKPPNTPVPYGGAPDLYGMWRNLSGVPYDPAQDPSLQQVK